jgi:hypothetical protein
MLESGITPQKKPDCCMAGIRAEPASPELPLRAEILRKDF